MSVGVLQTNYPFSQTTSSPFVKQGVKVPGAIVTRCYTCAWAKLECSWCFEVSRALPEAAINAAPSKNDIR